MRYALIAILLGAALALADHPVEAEDVGAEQVQVDEVPATTPAVDEAR